MELFRYFDALVRIMDILWDTHGYPIETPRGSVGGVPTKSHDEVIIIKRKLWGLTVSHPLR